MRTISSKASFTARDSKEDPPRRSKGESSRDAILLAAAELATTKGLDGLSIGDLAAHLGMSKSGLYAHFKSKEELELATIERAFEIVNREVLEPAMKAPAGVRRLLALADAFISHLRRKVFTGGCFFAGVVAELDTRPGRARDRVARLLHEWLSFQKQCVKDAQANGEIDPRADVDQVVFETEAMLMCANFMFVMMNDPTPLAQAHAGVENVLARYAAKSAGKKPKS